MKIPTYLSNFECIGGKCEDPCCNGFQVPVEQKTYEKYLSIDDSETREDIISNITINQNPQNDMEYSYIDAKCSCPFMTEEGLCGIQLQLGEEYLSGACSKYPRRLNAIDKAIEKSATVSCPEVARLVLLNEEGLSFKESEEEVDERDVAIGNIQTDMLPMTNYFYELRDFTIDVLQDRTKSLGERLNLLEGFYYEMAGLVEEGREGEIESLMILFKDQDIIVERPEHIISPEKVLAVIEELRNKEKFVWRYELTTKEMASGYTNLDSSIGENFIQEHEYMLENYLVNYVFKNLFPFSYGRNVYEAMAMLRLHHDLIVQHIVGVASSIAYMDKKTALRVIQSWSKEAEHSVSYLDTMFERI